MDKSPDLHTTADSMERPVNPLASEPVGRLLIQYVVPSILSTLMASLYNMVDQMFIGQRIGFLGNAATTVAYPLTFLCGALTILFSNGSSVNFNISNGRGEKDKALSGGRYSSPDCRGNTDCHAGPLFYALVRIFFRRH